MRAPFLSRMVREESGATLIEFAFVAPIFCVLLLGAFDFGHTLYTQAVLQGTIQKAARDSSLEGNTGTTQQNAIDQHIEDAILLLDHRAEVTITRRYYKTFEEASEAKAEEFTDTNGNGSCDNNEPYTDANNNNVWDPDGGSSGQGGAKDLVVYTADVQYPRIVPLQGFIPGMKDTVNLRAQTVLANQPYGDQSSYGDPTVRNCTP